MMASGRRNLPSAIRRFSTKAGTLRPQHGADTQRKAMSVRRRDGPAAQCVGVAQFTRGKDRRRREQAAESGDHANAACFALGASGPLDRSALDLEADQQKEYRPSKPY